VRDAIVEPAIGRDLLALGAVRSLLSFGDLKGIAEFTRRFPRFNPLVLCDPNGRATVERAGLPAMSWREFLLAGPPVDRRGAPASRT
jgi:hypothetical protein